MRQQGFDPGFEAFISVAGTLQVSPTSFRSGHFHGALKDSLGFAILLGVFWLHPHSRSYLSCGWNQPAPPTSPK
jgi:hypothetical protein